MYSTLFMMGWRRGQDSKQTATESDIQKARHIQWSIPVSSRVRSPSLNNTTQHNASIDLQWLGKRVLGGPPSIREPAYAEWGYVGASLHFLVTAPERMEDGIEPAKQTKTARQQDTARTRKNKRHSGSSSQRRRPTNNTRRHTCAEFEDTALASRTLTLTIRAILAGSRSRLGSLHPSPFLSPSWH